jgi:hypothetical protein
MSDDTGSPKTPPAKNKGGRKSRAALLAEQEAIRQKTGAQPPEHVPENTPPVSLPPKRRSRAKSKKPIQAKREEHQEEVTAIPATFVGKPQHPRAPSPLEVAKAASIATRAELDPRIYEHAEQLKVEQIDATLILLRSFISPEWAEAMNVSLVGVYDLLTGACEIAEYRQSRGYPVDLPYRWINKDSLDRWDDPLWFLRPK